MERKNISEIQKVQEKTVLCLGMFDGVHKGHQALIHACCQYAREHELEPCAFTFDRILLHGTGKQESLPELTCFDRKCDWLHYYGIQTVYYTTLDEHFSTLSAEQFFKDILLDALNASCLVAGFHYHFGSNASGDHALLSTLCRQFQIDFLCIPPVTDAKGTLISSTRIRSLIAQGEKDEALALLGHPL